MIRRWCILVPALLAMIECAHLGPGVAAGQVTQPFHNDRATPVVRVFQAAKDSVANISTTRLVSTRAGFFGLDDAFDEIFQSPYDHKVPVQSLGSGFLIHPSGYIVTNEHVVRRAEQITVSLADGTTHDAQVISTDPQHDLAVLKIAPPPGKLLPALPLGRSDDLMIGETVIAIGNPFGYQTTVTTGVVSAVNRQMEFARGVKFTDLIQTDASINPGNSGGPLLNVNAQVIGINSAIRADAQGIGFAISVNALTGDLPKLLDFRRINRVAIGMEVRQAPSPDGGPGPTSGEREIIVSEVQGGGPADGAGVRKGDVVKELDGQPAGGVADYCVHMLSRKPGETVELKVQRGPGGAAVPQTVICRILLAERPNPDGAALARRYLGLTLRAITPAMVRDMRLPTGRGVLVGAIDRGSPGEGVGLNVGDVVFQLGSSYLAGMDDVGRVLEDVEPGETLRIGIARGPTRAWVPIRASLRPGVSPDQPATATTRRSP